MLAMVLVYGLLSFNISNLPASFSNLCLVQCLMIFANGRTRSSNCTYVLIMRVFSSAKGLLTLMSHASCSSGSQHFTIGTLAAALQTTFSMPSTPLSATIL